MIQIRDFYVPWSNRILSGFFGSSFLSCYLFTPLVVSVPCWDMLYKNYIVIIILIIIGPSYFFYTNFHKWLKHHSSTKARDQPPVLRPFLYDEYSSFECIAGNQNFDFPVSSWHFGPKADEPYSRSCLLRNVCLLRNKQKHAEVEIVYYQNPAVEGLVHTTMRLDTSFPLGITSLGLITWLNGTRYSPRIVSVPRPNDLSFAPKERFYILDDLSDPSNYGHLLMDTVVAPYSVADLWGVDPSDVQLIGVNNCETAPRLKVIQTIPGTGVSTVKRCKNLTKDWLPLLYKHNYLFPPYSRDICFKTLAVGSTPFSLAGIHLNRGAIFRKMRTRLLNALQIKYSAGNSRHKVIVYLKRVEWVGSEVNSLCEQVNVWVAILDQLIDVTCIVPAEMSIKEQLLLASTASVFVAEHGSTTYISIFHPPGTSLIIVYPSSSRFAKEASAMLYNVDIQTWYIDSDRLEKSNGTEGSALLRLALHNAGVRLNILQHVGG